MVGRLTACVRGSSTNIEGWLMVNVKKGPGDVRSRLDGKVEIEEEEEVLFTNYL